MTTSRTGLFASSFIYDIATRVAKELFENEKKKDELKANLNHFNSQLTSLNTKLGSSSVRELEVSKNLYLPLPLSKIILNYMVEEEVNDLQLLISSSQAELSQLNKKIKSLENIETSLSSNKR